MPLSFMIYIAIFYIVSVIITIMSFTSVQTSKIRIKYIRFHRIILLTLVVLWACPLISNIMILYGDERSTLFTIFNTGSFISLLISGGVINIVRFYCDPYMWQQVKSMLFERRKKRYPEIQKEREEKEKEEDEEIDIWNLPLAQAVATFHHQSVVSNIIEIVLETCDNILEENTLMRDGGMLEPEGYNYEGSVIGMGDIRKYLESGDTQDVKKLIKINKTFEMVCLDYKEENNEKKIYKKSNYEKEEFKINESEKASSYYSRNTSNSGSSNISGKLTSFGKRLKEKQNLTIQVKSYADPVFVALRLLDGISFEELSKTLNLSMNAESIRKARESLGASGSFFFFSYDHRLVIKTITEKECKVFLNFLPEYYEHILKNPSSLISRAYGLFEVEIAGVSKIYFMMMENTLKTFENNEVLFKKYDLKGSTIKREVKDINADVFKDINYLKSDDAFILMTKERKTKLLSQLFSDITLLSSHNIMDYSLLLGVGHHRKIKKESHLIFNEEDLENESEKNEWRCFDDGYQITGKIYSLSLIDYLQEFDSSKYIELKLKKIFKGGGDISSVDTQTYLKRFKNFVSRIIVVYKN